MNPTRTLKTFHLQHTACQGKRGRLRLKCYGTRAETRFRLSAKRKSLFKSAGGRQFSRLLAAEVCASAVVMLDTPCSEVVWRVQATHSIRQFPPHFPSRASPRAIIFQQESTKGDRVQYTGCSRRNMPNFGRAFLRLKYTDITLNTYIQSWTVTEIMPGEVWNFDSCYTLTDYQIHTKLAGMCGFCNVNICTWHVINICVT